MELSTNVRDAILEQVRKCEKGTIPPSAENQKRITALLELLNKGLGGSLISDVLEDMVAATESAAIQRTIELFGSHINSESLVAFDPDRIVRRIFNPILGSPQEASIDWMAKVIEAQAKFLNGMEEQTKDEISTRLRKASQTASLPATTTQALMKIASNLDVDLTKPDAEESEAKEADAAPKT